MFYESVKKACETGKVRIGLPAFSDGDRVTIEAKGLTNIKAAFLTSGERQKLAFISHKLSDSHRLALNYLKSKRPQFVSAEEVGREIGEQLGMERWGSAFGLPLCNKLVSVGLVVQNDAGFYAAVSD